MKDMPDITVGTQYYRQPKGFAATVVTQLACPLQGICIGGVIAHIDGRVKAVVIDKVSQCSAFVDLNGRAQFEDHPTLKQVQVVFVGNLLGDRGECLFHSRRVFCLTIVDRNSGSLVLNHHPRMLSPTERS